MTIKALYPIGKTQWSKWNDDQKTAFNEARAAGVAYADAIDAANNTKHEKKHGVLNVLKDVAEVAAVVSGAAEAVAPVVAVAKAVRGRPKK